MAKDSLEERANHSDSLNSNNENNLEEIVKNHKPRSAIGKIFDYAIAAGAVFASYSLIGPMALVANAISFVGDRIVNYRRKRDTPSRQTRDSALLSSLFSIPGKFAFDLMNKFINVKTIGGWLLRGFVQSFIYAPIMGIAGTFVGYPLVNRSYKGLYEMGYKELWWKNYKDGLKYFALPNMLVARYLPPQTHFPINLGLGMVYRTTIGSRYLTKLDPYLYEHELINGKSIKELKQKYQP